MFLREKSSSKQLNSGFHYLFVAKARCKHCCTK
jgi:hypothetical protein